MKPVDGHELDAVHISEDRLSKIRSAQATQGTATWEAGVNPHFKGWTTRRVKNLKIGTYQIIIFKLMATTSKIWSMARFIFPMEKQSLEHL